MIRRLAPLVFLAATIAVIALGALLAPVEPAARAQGVVPTSTRVPPTATPRPLPTPHAYLPAVQTGAGHE